MIGTDGYKKLQGRFRVATASLSRKCKLETWIIEDFYSSEDVVNAILSTSHLALLGRQPFKRFRNAWVMDGGITCDHITTNHLPKDLQPKTITFRVGYDSFPTHLLHFQQAMPLLTLAKWNRMFKEGQLAFDHMLLPAVQEWLTTWFVPVEGKSTLFHYQPQFDCSNIPTFPEKQAQHQLRGIATGWIDVVGGYIVHGLYFVWKFILNHPL